MNVAISRYTLKDFLEGVYRRIESVIQDHHFDSLQMKLLQASVGMIRERAPINPIGDPLAIFYLIVKAWKQEPDKQAEHLAAFCILYILALDLFDDVQDEDLSGKPYEEVGPSIAINNAIALLFLALDELRMGIQLEPDEERKLAYLEVFNRISILAVNGQHRDLMGEQGARTSQEILEMQLAKTSSLALVAECAALYAGCSKDTIQRYRQASEQMVLLVQIVDDIRDIFGKSLSPDLATGKATYPLACFKECATPHQLEQLDRLRSKLPDSLKEIRTLLYESGAIQRAAETIERLREGIHQELAAIGNTSASQRTWLYIFEPLASAIYKTPKLESSRSILQPNGPWHCFIREVAQELHTSLSNFDPPDLPLLLPWHLPQWMYDPQRKTIFYPDIEGQPEEVLPFQAELLGIQDLCLVQTLIKNQAPILMAHEFFHYWRDASGNLSQDSWFEEWAAHRLAIAHTKAHHPALMSETIALAERVLKHHPEGISKRGNEILASFLSSDYAPRKEAIGYGVTLSEVGLIQLAMAIQLYQEELELEQVIVALLPEKGTS